MKHPQPSSQRSSSRSSERGGGAEPPRSDKRTPNAPPHSKQRETPRLSRLAILLAVTMVSACGPRMAHPEYSAPFPVPRMTPIEMACRTEIGEETCVLMLRTDFREQERELIARCIALGWREKDCLPK